MRVRIPDLMAEEATWEKPPKDAPLVRQIRWALLHGESFTADEAAERWDMNPSILSQIVAQFREAGYVVTDKRDNGRKRFSVGGLAIPKPKRRRSTPTHGIAGQPETGHRHSAPWLGSNLRVVMLAESEEGKTALVLLDEYGTRWPVVMDGGPL